MISPLNMLQEQQIGKPHAPWRVLVVCILLNQTHGRQVRPMIDRFFGLCHEPRELLICANDPDIVENHLKPMLRPLGFFNRRLQYLRNMSEAYCRFELHGTCDFWKFQADGEWAHHMPGCGQYAVDSLNIFVYGILERASSDTWLNDYIEWAHAQISVEEFRQKHPEIVKFWREHV